MVADLHVELSKVSGTLSACDAARNTVALPHVQVLLHVKYRLFPMSVLLVGRRGEHHGSLQVAKGRIEPGHQAVNPVRILHL